MSDVNGQIASRWTPFDNKKKAVYLVIDDAHRN